MKRLYYKTMAEVTEHIGWQLFIFDAFGTGHGRWLKASEDYKRKLAMLDHPSNG